MGACMSPTSDEILILRAYSDFSSALAVGTPGDQYLLADGRCSQAVLTFSLLRMWEGWYQLEKTRDVSC